MSDVEFSGYGERMSIGQFRVLQRQHTRRGLRLAVDKVNPGHFSCIKCGGDHAIDMSYWQRGSEYAYTVCLSCWSVFEQEFSASAEPLASSQS